MTVRAEAIVATYRSALFHGRPLSRPLRDSRGGHDD